MVLDFPVVICPKVPGSTARPLAEIAKFESLYFTRRRFRQLINEHDPARILELCKLVLDVLFERFSQLVRRRDAGNR